MRWRYVASDFCSLLFNSIFQSDEDHVGNNLVMEMLVLTCMYRCMVSILRY